MADNILFALWYFLPAGVANVTPILAANAPVLRRWNTPIDFGKSWRGTRIFGDHKTWRGLVCGVLAGALVAIIQFYAWSPDEWWQLVDDKASMPGLFVLALAITLSLGALVGDAIKSFFKRRVNVPSGKSWFPFDQLDYIIGGLLLSAPIVVLSVSQYAWIVATWFGMHLLFSYIGYLTHFKDEPI